MVKDYYDRFVTTFYKACVVSLVTDFTHLRTRALYVSACYYKICNSKVIFTATYVGRMHIIKSGMIRILQTLIPI